MEKRGGSGKVEYQDPLPTPLLDVNEFRLWSFYRAIIAEFVSTFLLLYVLFNTIIGQANEKSPCGGVGVLEFVSTFLLLYVLFNTIIGQANEKSPCGGVGVLGIAWATGGMLFVQVYCTAGISGGHVNPAVTFGFLVARKASLNRAVLYMVAQCAGAVCAAGVVKEMQKFSYYSGGGGVNLVAAGYTKGTALGAEIIGTFVLVYTIFSATDPKRNARDSHIPVLAPLPIGFALFAVILATAHITGTSLNPARSFGPAVIYDHKNSWEDLWIFWVGPLVGAAGAATYHQYVLRAGGLKALESYRTLSPTATPR